MKCQNCNCETEKGYSLLSSSIEKKGLNVKFLITKDGKPVQFCRDCVELIFFQWAKHVWEEVYVPENATNEELIDNLKRAIKIQTGILFSLMSGATTFNPTTKETSQ